MAKAINFTSDVGARSVSLLCSNTSISGGLVFHLDVSGITYNILNLNIIVDSTNASNGAVYLSPTMSGSYVNVIETNLTNIADTSSASTHGILIPVTSNVNVVTVDQCFFSSFANAISISDNAVSHTVIIRRTYFYNILWDTIFLGYGHIAYVHYSQFDSGRAFDYIRDLVPN